MRRVRTLYRAFASNLEMPKPDGNKRQKLYSMFGMIAFIGIMIPVSVIVGYVTYKMTDLLYMFDGNAYALLSELHLMSAFALIFGLPLMFSVLFFSSDLNFLTSLPLKPEEIFAARFFHTYKAENVMTSNVLFAMFIGYFVAAYQNSGSYALHPFSLFGALFSYAGATLIPLIYCSILGLLLMTLLRKINRIELYYHSSSALFLIFAAIFLFSFKDYGSITTENYLNSLIEQDNAFTKLCNILFPTNMLTIKTIEDHEIMPLILSLFFICGLFAACMLLTKATYKEGLFAAAISGGKKRSQRKIRTYFKKKSKFRALFIKEVKVLTRTVTYRMNCVFANLIWPLIVPVIAFMTGKDKILAPFALKLQAGETKENCYLLIAITAISFIASGLNSIASTSFTREGVHLDMIKYLPAETDKQIKAKGLTAIMFTFIPVTFSIMMTTIVLKVPLLMIPFIPLSLLCIFIATSIGMTMDSISPYTIWSDELSALRGNTYCFFNLAAELVISLILGLLIYVTSLLSGSFIISCSATLSFMLAAAVFEFKFGSKRIAGNLRELT